MFDNDNYNLDRNMRFLEFSGLRSLENEDIYEGMVISAPCINSAGELYENKEDFKAVIVFKNGRFELERKGIDNISLSDFIRTETGRYASKKTNLKIIGWWFDFPELLSSL